MGLQAVYWNLLGVGRVPHFDEDFTTLRRVCPNFGILGSFALAGGIFCGHGRAVSVGADIRILRVPLQKVELGYLKKRQKKLPNLLLCGSMPVKLRFGEAVFLFMHKA